MFHNSLAVKAIGNSNSYVGHRGVYGLLVIELCKFFFFFFKLSGLYETSFIFHKGDDTTHHKEKTSVASIS